MRFFLTIFFLFSVCYGQPVISLNVSRQVLPLTGGRPVYLLFDGDLQVEWYNGNFSASFEVLPNVTWVWLEGNYDNFIIEAAEWTGDATAPTYTLYNEARSQSLSVSAPSGFQAYAQIEAATTQAAAFDICWVKIVFTNFNATSEVRFKGDLQSSATNIYPDPVAAPPDAGIFFQGGGMIQNDTSAMDCYPSIRKSYNTWMLAPYQFSSGYNNQAFKFSVYGDDGNAGFMGAAKRRGHQVQIYHAGASAKAVAAALDTLPPIDYNAFNVATNMKDISPGSDSTLYASWINQKRLDSAIAYLWGNNPSASIGGLDIRGTVVSPGQNMVNVVEVGGQEDTKNWINAQANHRRDGVWFQKIRAGYDGIKANDPNLKAYTAAVPYWDSSDEKSIFIQSYFQYGRGVFPFNGRCFNQYISSAYSGQPQGFDSDSAISPEKFGVYSLGLRMVEIRNRYRPGTATEITEVGFAINPESNYDVQGPDSAAKRIIAADYLIRTMSQYGAAGVEKVYHYWHTSDNTVNFGSMVAIQYGSPTIYMPTYYWLTTRRNVLQNCKRKSTVIQNGDSTGVWVMKYDHVSNADSAVYEFYDAQGSTTNFALNVGSVIGTPVKTTLTNGDFNGVEANQSLSGGVATISNINGTPGYLAVLELGSFIQIRGGRAVVQ